MAKQETTPDSLALKAFVITMVAATLYISVVFVFVIGGNRREEAAENAAAAAAGGAVQSAHEEHGVTHAVEPTEDNAHKAVQP